MAVEARTAVPVEYGSKEIKYYCPTFRIWLQYHTLNSGNDYGLYVLHTVPLDLASLRAPGLQFPPARRWQWQRSKASMPTPSTTFLSRPGSLHTLGCSVLYVIFVFGVWALSYCHEAQEACTCSLEVNEQPSA